MPKQIVTLFILSLFFSAKGQERLNEVLSSVAINNKSIAATRHYVESKSLEYQTGITLNNPSISADYLIGQPVSGGNQFDFLAIQEFDFPTAYSNRGTLADQKIEMLQYAFEEFKQNILFESKILVLELIYLNQYQLVLLERKTTSEKLVANYKLKYEAEDISALAYNKAKIQLLGIQSQLRMMESLLIIANQKLSEMNGGIALALSDTIYPATPTIPEFEVLNDSIEANDPRLKWLSMQSESFQTQLKLTKSMALPQFEAGYHYQTVLGQTFNGVHVGFTVPLWQQKNTIKASKSMIEYGTSQTDEHKIEHHYSVKKLYEKSLILKENIAEYKMVLSELNSEDLLYTSLNLGEIDFITYAMEIEYYYKAKDELFALEKEYQMIVAELFKYKL